jgi:branched-chain amino acid transport system substrate-binding protein
MLQKIKCAIILVLLLSIFLIINCSKDFDSEEIAIGAIFDLTGSLSYMGNWSLEGALLAQNEINAKGGINGKKIKLIIEDAETNPQKATTIFQKQITVDNVKVVIGFNGSSEVMAAAPIANRSKVILFSTGGASPNITKAGDYVFRNRLSGGKEASSMADIAFNKLNFKSGIILFINTDYGKSYAEAFKKHFQSLGGNLLYSEGFNQDENDFKVLLNKANSKTYLQFIYLASHVREAGMILKQAKEINFNTRWLASNAVESPELFKIAGNASEGLMFTVEKYDPKSNLSYVYNENYKKKFKRDSEMFAAHAYDAVKLLSMIISKVGNNAELIKTELYNTKDYVGVSGLTTFDANGDVSKEVIVKIVKNLKFIELSTYD